MTPIKLIASGINVAPIAWALREHPEFWNQHTARTEDPSSPHHGLDDIWARFGAPSDASKNEYHKAEWYECADVLGIKPMVAAVFDAVGGSELGGVLITRIPPGAECKPHEDHGWHAKYYEKFALQIEASPGQEFCFEDARLETKPGDLFWFDNSYTHWVTNPTKYDRVTMIICIKR